MASPQANIFYNSAMSSIDFNRLSLFILNNYGIKLPPSKKTMLEGRLHKRLKATNISTFKEYCDYVFSPQGQQLELVHMIDVVTTNKTDFFREAAHFDFLLSNVLPTFVANNPISKHFNVWSAGCSTGEEVYTLAMVLNEYTEKRPGFDFRILGTDISSRALETAVTAVYSEERVNVVSLPLKRRYLLKSKSSEKRTVRIVPHLREKASFGRLNFIEGDFSAIPNFNAIFCRNVLIYFDRQTQEKVVRKLCSKLEAGGFLFLGHSESISTLNLPLTQIQPTIFKKI